MNLEKLDQAFNDMKNAAADLEEADFWAAWRRGKLSLAALQREKERQAAEPEGMQDTFFLPLGGRWSFLDTDTMKITTIP